jgi:hypothetical protein
MKVVGRERGALLERVKRKEYHTVCRAMTSGKIEVESVSIKN